MRDPEAIVLHSADALAGDVAGRLAATLAHALQQRPRAALALTAGSIMERVWSELARSPAAADAVDWSRVDVFWGDERFVPAGDDDRNDVPAEQLLFGAEPFSAARRFPMPAAGGEFGDDLDAAAAGYARTLYDARREDDQDDVPNFDVVLLGVGPDGHCCSLFPEHPSVHDDSGTVIAVRNSPKPPPLRLSLTLRRAQRRQRGLGGGIRLGQGGGRARSAWAGPDGCRCRSAGAARPVAHAVAAGPGGGREAAAVGVPAAGELSRRGCAGRRVPRISGGRRRRGPTQPCRTRSSGLARGAP